MPDGSPAPRKQVVDRRRRDHPVHEGRGSARLLPGELRLRPRRRPRDDTDRHPAVLYDKRGFCVQFASAYAVWRGRSASRHGSRSGSPRAIPRDGVFHVQSHDAHAWPEIWLAGLGWTHLFDPTPPAGQQRHHRRAAARCPATRRWCRPANTGRRDHAPRPADYGGPRRDRHSDDRDHDCAPVPPLVTTTAPGGDSQPWLVVIAILAAIVAAVLIYVAVVINAKARRRARRRERGRARGRGQGAWDEALDKLREAHVPPDPALTPLELAGSAPRPRGHRSDATVAQPGALVHRRSLRRRAGVERRRRARAGTRSTSSTARSTRGSPDANGGAAASTRRRSARVAGESRPNW